jgi:hypothetical protein
VVLRRVLELLHGQRNKRLEDLVLQMGWLLKGCALEQHAKIISVFITGYNGVSQTRALGLGQPTNLALASWRRPLAAALHEPALDSVRVVTRFLLSSRFL